MEGALGVGGGDGGCIKGRLRGRGKSKDLHPDLERL